jgi:hypothetical protein
MRGLIRSALVLSAVGLALIGCNRSGTSEDSSVNQKPIDTPFQAAFRVPGMS